jgi:hypothetical protein
MPGIFSSPPGGGGGGGGTAASQLDLGNASGIDVAGVVTIDLDQAYTAYLLTLDQDTTIELTGGSAAKQVELILIQNGTGGFHVSWQIGTYFSGGVPPLFSLAAAAETRVSVYCDGTRILVGSQGRRLGAGNMAAGTLTISDSNISSNSRLLFSRQAGSGTLGHLQVARTVGTSFTITSGSGSEASNIFWEIIDSAVSSVAPPADPSTILGANLLAWYEASDSSTIHLTTSAVTQWDDKSGNARNLTNNTANHPPMSSINGVDAVYFDNAGTDESLITGANLPISGTTQNLTIWMVIQLDSAAGDKGLLGGAVPVYQYHGTNIYLNPNGASNFGGGTLSTSPLLICFQVKVSTFDNTNSLYRINGVTQTANLTGGNENLPASQLVVGTYGGVGPCAFKIGALVYSNNAPNLATIQAVEDYLNNIYSVY